MHARLLLLWAVLAAFGPVIVRDAVPHQFVLVSGNQLYLADAPIQLKGVNYYPQGRPWADMWWDWNAPQIAREWRQARDELGINTVRVLLPYNSTGQADGLGKMPPQLFRQLHELTQIAGDLNLRLIVTLFDFYYNFKQPGTPEFARDLAYVRAVVGAFANDERILAWDIHNEPDHYGAWGDQRSAVQHWLALIADEIHRVTPHQLVTVGMGQIENLWLAGPDGRSALDYSDFVSVHTYDAGAIAQQLHDLRTRTAKPIILEEFGWPTGPACTAPNYSEATQVNLYRDTLAAAGQQTSGALAWVLRDYDQAQSLRWDTREEHFGLYRADGTLKPAAAVLRAAPGQPLPSATYEQFPLTDTSVGTPNDEYAPLPIAGTGFHVKGMFRLAWEQFGGAASFGLPLGDAFQLPNQRIATQYFERAVLTFNPDARRPSAYDTLTLAAKIRLTVTPEPLGLTRVDDNQQITFYPVARRFQALYEQVTGAWRLGAAITPERLERRSNVIVHLQTFERGQLEFDPRMDEPRIAALGSAAWKAQCASFGL